MNTETNMSTSKVDAARRSVSRQYILITPNAIEGRARLDKDVKIIRLVLFQDLAQYRVANNVLID
jgi:hypothetical protein